VSMISASGSQVSNWYEEKSHSLFTYWWLKGLQGEADADKNSEITVGELDEYVTENVSYWAGKLNLGKQNPTTNGDPERVLVRLAPEKNGGTR